MMRERPPFKQQQAGIRGVILLSASFLHMYSKETDLPGPALLVRTAAFPHFAWVSTVVIVIVRGSSGRGRAAQASGLAKKGKKEKKKGRASFISTYQHCNPSSPLFIYFSCSPNGSLFPTHARRDWDHRL